MFSISADELVADSESFPMIRDEEIQKLMIASAQMQVRCRGRPLPPLPPLKVTSNPSHRLANPNEVAANISLVRDQQGKLSNGLDPDAYDDGVLRNREDHLEQPNAIRNGDLLRPRRRAVLNEGGELENQEGGDGRHGVEENRRLGPNEGGIGTRGHGERDRELILHDRPVPTQGDNLEHQEGRIDRCGIEENRHPAPNEGTFIVQAQEEHQPSVGSGHLVYSLTHVTREGEVFIHRMELDAAIDANQLMSQIVRRT